jgi:hypothetical protein
MDDKAPTFDKFPPDGPTAAKDWATAVDAYASAVIPPSTTAAAAKSALQGALAGMSAPGAALVAFPAAFTAYAAALGGGMAPAFVAVPPPAPLVLAPVFALGMTGAPASAVVAQIASIIDLWFRTGTATPAAGGPPVPWS